MARQWIRVVVGLGACLALAGSATAQTGTITLTDGLFEIGSQQAMIDPGNPPVLGYSYDGAGTLVLPADQAVFPPVVVPAPPPLNEIEIDISLTEDGSGAIDPVGGSASVSVSLFFALVNPFLPEGCGIGPVAVNPTTDVSGKLTGTPYDSSSGTAGFVENVYEVPRSSGCSIFGPAIDGQLGLPSPSGNNRAILSALFDPAI
jgi:hypothetical protein